MWGVVPVEETKFQPPVKELNKMPFSHLLTAMVTCHSLTLIDGKLNGDPLDLKVSIFDIIIFLIKILFMFFIVFLMCYNYYLSQFLRKNPLIFHKILRQS